MKEYLLTFTKYYLEIIDIDSWTPLMVLFVVVFLNIAQTAFTLLGPDLLPDKTQSAACTPKRFNQSRVLKQT